MFNIEKKIHDIRSKPESVRMRWVWILVSICMIIIILIWAISLRVNLSQSGSEGSSIRDFSESINDSLKEEDGAASIEDLLEDGKETLEQTKESQELLNQLELEQVEPGVSLDSILE